MFEYRSGYTEVKKKNVNKHLRKFKKKKCDKKL